MKIVSKRFALLLCALSPSLMVTGCPDAVYCRNGVCTGYYYDSLVSGLTYESRGEDGVTYTGVTGEDDDPGRFTYAEGDTVSFSLGDVSLGETIAKERVTPFDVAGIEEEAIGGCEVDGTLPADTDAFRKVVNLAILLQTLDTDGDDTNGIDIGAEVAALFEGANLDIDQPGARFQEDPGLQTLVDDAFSGDRTLVEIEDALRALYVGLGLCPSIP
jgi:hypothetical protein